jgi:solute:Na+ symporter, SSS family
MTRPLAVVDIIIVVVYLAGTTLLGAWFTRRQRDTRKYFLGDKNIPWWLILISIVTTETSIVTYLSVPGLAFKPGGNLAFLQLAFGYVIGRVIIAWLLLPMYFRGECFTAYQVLRQRFGTPVQRAASGLFMLTRTVADGLRLFLTGLLLQQCTGWPMELSIVVVGMLTLIYTFLGGMQAIIWTDVIQFVLKMLGAILAAVLILTQLPGGWENYLNIGTSNGRFDLLDFRPNPAIELTFWTGMIGGAIFTMASHGVDQMMVQRYLCARSLNQARAALVLSGIVVLIQFLLFLLIGVGLFALAQGGQLPLPQDIRPDAVFGLYIVNHLPVGIVGLVLAAMLAAAMSTLSSSLNSSANAAVTDYYRPIRAGRSEAHYLLVARGFTIFFGFAQIAVAIAAFAFLSTQRSIITHVLSVAGFTTGILLGLFVLGGRSKPVSSTSALIGMAVGILTVTGVWLPATWGQPIVAWPWFAPIGALTTVCVATVCDWANRKPGAKDLTLP